MIAFCNILATVCDFPEPVEPTMAKCLLKKRFPLTGVSTEISCANLEKQKRSPSFKTSLNIAFMSSCFAGNTFVGGIVNESPPRENLLSSITPSGFASII